METENRSTKRFVAHSGRAFAGLILVVIGGVLLSREFGVYFPEWLLSWQVLLISLGAFFGARRLFRPGGWMVMILAGSVFLLLEFYPDISIRHYIWPVAIILFGLWMIIRPKRRRQNWAWNQDLKNDRLIRK